MTKLKSALQHAEEQLKATSPTPKLDAEVLMCEVLQVGRAYLIAHDTNELSETDTKAFEAYIQQRLTGKPIAYILNHREFWSLNLKVDESTLIPRPDTECLVEQALLLFDKKTKLQVLELGTGTGAIALALAKERPNWDILATDIHASTLEVAKHNVKQHQATRITLLQSNWFESVPKQQFDLIISNPPYITENDEHLDMGDVRFEPKRALTSGPEGLDDLKHIIRLAKAYLKPQGVLMFEHGYHQAEALIQLMTDENYQDIQSICDYSGHDRVIYGRSRLK